MNGCFFIVMLWHFFDSFDVIETALRNHNEFTEKDKIVFDEPTQLTSLQIKKPNQCHHR